MSKKSKFISNLLKILVFTLALNIFSVVNVFAIDDGIYIVPTTTYYVNPETGKVDDKGNGDIALGEAMSRSTLGTTALLEVKDNKAYVTMRLELISSISGVKIFTQPSKGGSYSQVKASVMAENYTKDYADYRFEMKDTSSYVRFEFYVAPMGRDVIFFASIDTNKAVSGSGDFVTSIKVEPTTKATTEATTVTTTEATTVATTKATTTETTTKATTAETTTAKTTSTKEEETVKETQTSVDTSSSSSKSDANTETVTTQSTSLENNAKNDDLQESTDTVLQDNEVLLEEDETLEEDTQEDDEAVAVINLEEDEILDLEDTSSSNTVLYTVIGVVVLAVIIGLIVYFVKKKS